MTNFSNIKYGASAIVAVMCAQVPATFAQAQETVTTSNEIDPVRYEAAKTAVDHLWPIGTYRRIMDSTMTEMIDTMLSNMFEMKSSDFETGEEGAEDEEQTSLGAEMEAKDPHARERFEITMKVMMAEITPLMESMEPSIRESMAIVYAKRFDVKELTDMNAFFATPSGQAYAREAMMLMVNPEIMGASQEFVPEFMMAMPAIMEKVEEATSHLPPPPTPEYGVDAMDEAYEANDTEGDE